LLVLVSIYRREWINLSLLVLILRRLLGCLTCLQWHLNQIYCPPETRFARLLQLIVSPVI
ncbi:MAG: hypothetical protein MH219_03660, partial [Marinobacter sp.]|nr:hypothetical protein [Marinobacter sp.]